MVDPIKPSGLSRFDFGHWLFAQDCRFLMAAAQVEQFPEISLPEVAFAGRSNVGKSSLVNALTGRKTLARTSNTPGRTQQLIFFDLGGRLVLVDLPGFGYAAASKRAVRAWSAVSRLYLKGRPNLRRVLLLLDSRHGLKPPDRSIMAELDQAAVTYQIILTKADKASDRILQERIDEIRAETEKSPAAHTEVLVTSAKKGHGIAELRAELAGLVDGPTATREEDASHVT